MTVMVESREDFTIDFYRRVAWAGEPVRISDAAVEVMAESRKRFMALLEREPDAVIYGVTTG